MSQISTKLARKLVQNFKNDKVSKTYKKSDTKGVWFSKEVLLEALTTKVGGVDPTGLRFYFAAYEGLVSGRPPKHEHKANKTTLVIIPTRGKNKDGVEVRYPDIPTGEVIHFDLLTDPNALPSYDNSFREYNDGQICPPPPLDEEGLYEKI